MLVGIGECTYDVLFMIVLEHATAGNMLIVARYVVAGSHVLS
jgi:hypothetical protein